MFNPDVTKVLSRRRLIQFGAGSYLGLNLGGLWRARADAPVLPKSIRSCVFLFLYGGPSHIDTFDPKPNAPAEVRGGFNTIATSAPGVRVCEHLPRLARWMHKAAVVRSMHHAARLHDSASIHTHTGRPLDGPDRELFAPLPQHFPSHGGAVAALHAKPGGEVPFASLPFAFHNVVPTPCQGGGFLGSAYDPLQIDVDPDKRVYGVDAFRPQAGIDPERRRSRMRLLRSDRTGEFGPLFDKAVRLLDSDRIRTALDITTEPPGVRDRYGFGPVAVGGGAAESGHARHMRGQNFLLTRRLVEAGVPFVNVHDFKQQGQNWDAHANGFEQHKTHLLPQLDMGLSALVEDLDARGLLDSTLIVVTGEFGRTPRINPSAGRDHWPDCYSVLLLGGGITGGAVHGASDRLGAFPAANPVTPGDLAATIFWRFGIDPHAEIRDQSGRPYPLATGDPLTRLFA